MATRVVGTKVRRVEDPRILTGRGYFVDDVQLPGMLHVAFVRSTVAHARILSVDVEEARAAEGVAAVFTGEDIKALTMPMQVMGPPAYQPVTFHPLAVDKVRFVGDPVVMVVASNRALAEDACELIMVDYEPLPAVTTFEVAMAEDAPMVFEELGGNVIYRDQSSWGDTEAAFAKADRVVRATINQHRHAHVPMECRGIVVTFNRQRDELTIYAAHQAPQMMRLAIAGLTGKMANRIKVLTADIGGSFGQKGMTGREDAAVAAAAIALELPVKWTEDRSENLAAAGQAREEKIDIEAAVTSQGRVLGLRANMTLDQGAYPCFGLASSLFPTIVKMLLPGPYKVEAFDFEATVVTSNKATYLAYRGPWEMEAFTRERLFDLIAGELGIDPVVMRRANHLYPDDFPATMVNGANLEGVTASETFERALVRSGYDEFRKEQALARESGRYLGIGLATFLEPAPGPPSWSQATGGNIPPERAHVRVEADGNVTVITSQSPHGQGHETTLAQLAADQIGVPFEQVKVVIGNTDVTPFSVIGTGGSRSATLASGAVMGAAADVKRQIQAAAGEMMEAAPDDIVIEDGQVMVAGVPSSALPLATVAMTSWMAPHLAGQASKPGLQATFDFSLKRGGWVNATHCAQVEVDINTGFVKILRFIVVEDCGEIIHPAIVAGQVCGGVAQGIGSVLYEKSEYDDEGNYQSSTFMDYLVPTAYEIPHIEIEHLESPPLDDEVNFRGVGEGGNVGAPAALVSAIADALTPFGARVTEKYLPPSRILELAGILPVA